MTTWLIAGARGMLAHDVIAEARSRGIDTIETDLPEMDITDPMRVMAHGGPYDAIINCAGWVNAETAEGDEGGTFAVNAIGPGHLARLAAHHDVPLVHISTDYVFGGDQREPYAEDAPVRPLSAYGRTKAAGEWAVRAGAPKHYVVRTAWLYGEQGPCFPQTITRVGRERGALSVVADQIGQPTWAADLARVIGDLLQAQAPFGIYHGTSSGEGSWADFAQAALESDGQDPAIVTPVTTAEYPTKAARPGYSALAHQALRAAGIEPIGDWRERWAEAAPSILQHTTS